MWRRWLPGFWWAPLFLVPLVFPARDVLYIVGLMCIYVLLATSINILTGLAGQVSFGHGALWAAGAYTSAVLTTRLGMPFWVGLAAAPVVAAATGLVMALPSLRVRGHYLAMVTFACGEIAHLVMLNWVQVTNGVNGIRNIPVAAFGPIRFDTEARFYWLALTAAVLGYLGFLRLRRSRSGIAFLSIRQDEVAAGVLGVEITRYKLLSFMVSAVYAGVAGALFAHFLRYVNPDSFRLDVSIAVVMMVVLGGMGYPASPWVGALIGVGSAELLRILGPLREVAYGLVLLAVLTYSPDGLVGLALRWSLRRAAAGSRRAAEERAA